MARTEEEFKRIEHFFPIPHCKRKIANLPPAVIVGFVLNEWGPVNEECIS